MRLAVNVRPVGEIDLLAPGSVHDVFQTAGMVEQLGVHDSPAEAESALG